MFEIGQHFQYLCRRSKDTQAQIGEIGAIPIFDRNVFITDLASGEIVAPGYCWSK